MNRYLISLSYKGTHYSGWQRQTNNSNTIQEILENILLQISKNKTTASGASRTDKGVHALDQKVYFDIDKDYETAKLVARINHRLPADIRVNSCKKIANHFNFNEKLKSKTYIYRIRTKPANAFENETSIHYPNLDLELLKSALNLFKGQHDFKNFSVSAGRPSLRKVDDIKIRVNSSEIIIKIKAKGFLKYMVRYLVGASIQVAKDELSLTKIKSELKKPSSNFKTKKAPAKGLILYKISL